MRPLRILCVPILSLVYLTSFSHCLPNGLSNSNDNAHRSNVRKTSSHLKEPNFPQGQIRPLTVKRVTFELPNGWIGRVDKYLSLIPIQVACQHLQEFYWEVQNRVMERWISQPPVNEFTIRWGEIQLHFSSPTGPIPWRFILAFLQQMVTETHLGFAGNYEVGDSI